MIRFALSFVFGALALFFLIEVGIASLWYEVEEENIEYAWLIAGHTHQIVSSAMDTHPPPNTAADLATTLGTDVEPLTHGVFTETCEEAAFMAHQNGLQSCTTLDSSDTIRVAVMLPIGPVSIDGSRLFWEAEDPGHPAETLSFPLLLVGMLILGLALGWGPRRQLQKLAASAQRLRDGDLSARATVSRHGLTEPMALAFNDMADHVQRTVEWQDLMLQTVAHELRTPLSRVRFIVTRIEVAGSREEQLEALAELDEELSDLESLISSVLTLVRVSRADPLETTPNHLCKALNSRLRRLEKRQRHRSQPLTIERIGLDAESPQAQVDLNAVSRVFDNLLNNAVAHARTRIRVSLAHSADAIRISVEDDGDGIAPEAREKVLDAFVQLDSSRTQSGTGLGLAIVRGLVEAHGNRLELTDSDLGGLQVFTTWPVAKQAK